MNESQDNLLWVLTKNAVSQMGGRLILSLLRFAIALQIALLAGTEVFGQYVVVLSLLMVGEWLTDFGLTDVGVLHASQNPQNRNTLLKTIAALRMFLALAGMAVLAIAVISLSYESDIRQACMVGAIGLIFHAGTLVYRVLFRVEMIMERDVGSELIGIICLVLMVAIAAPLFGTVTSLIACYVIAKFVQFVVAHYWGSNQFRLSSTRSNRKIAAGLIKTALPLGAAGLLVVTADIMVPIILSKLLDMHAVGIYSVALRFVLFAGLITQAISSTFYPLLSGYWNKDPERFRMTQQKALEISVVMAGFPLCALFAGSEFLMSFFGEGPREQHFILAFLSLSIYARTITGVLAPLLVIAQKQVVSLILTVVSLSTSFCLIFFLVNRYGVLGAVVGYVAADYLFTMLPVIVVSQRLADIQLKWLHVLKVTVAVFVAIGGGYLVGDEYGGLLKILAVLGFYLCLLIVFRSISILELKSLVDAFKTRNAEQPD